MLPDLPADDEMRCLTQRLELVPLTADDAIDLFPVLHDPALGRWTCDEPPADVHALRTTCEMWSSRRSFDGGELWLNWVARRREDDRAIGHLQATVGEEGTAVAWVIATPFQGQGFATEAARALIDWLLADLRVSPIVASIHPGNVASQTVARRIDMRPTERLDGGEVIWERATAHRASSGS
jgi:RimJ/RimL family protein N-acetyltransferase